MARSFPLIPISAADAAVASHPAKPGLFRRLLAAAIESQRRRAEREVARYLAASRAKFTDAGRARDRAPLAAPRVLRQLIEKEFVMSNVPSRAAELSRSIGSPPVAGVKHAWTFAAAVLAVLREAWAEAREMQRAAHRRHPHVGE